MRWLAASVCSLLFVHEAVDVRAAEPGTVRSAIDRALPLLATAARGSAEHRNCFTCHGQALPVFALKAAVLRGWNTDRELITEQADHTLSYLQQGLERYRAGQGQGGRADMAGYALWTLNSAGHAPDETTAVVVDFLLGYRNESAFWPPSSQRPPSEGSRFTATYVALRGIRDFGSPEQQRLAEPRIAMAREWLEANPGDDTEDRVFRLRALKLVNADLPLVRSAADELIKGQHADGGWSQTTELPSDAYATGTVLVALADESCLAPDHPAYVRGVEFLLSNQEPDGSWKVSSRSRPFQKYFETGFPHGTDQFISTSATGWATVALLKTIPLAADD